MGLTQHALTAAQCTYFEVDDKVTICHHTGSAKKPYQIIRTNSAGCASGHADRPRDLAGTRGGHVRRQRSCSALHRRQSQPVAARCPDEEDLPSGELADLDDAMDAPGGSNGGADAVDDLGNRRPVLAVGVDEVGAHVRVCVPEAQEVGPRHVGRRGPPRLMPLLPSPLEVIQARPRVGVDAPVVLLLGRCLGRRGSGRACPRGARSCRPSGRVAQPRRGPGAGRQHDGCDNQRRPRSVLHSSMLYDVAPGAVNYRVIPGCRSGLDCPSLPDALWRVCRPWPGRPPRCRGQAALPRPGGSPQGRIRRRSGPPRREAPSRYGPPAPGSWSRWGTNDRTRGCLSG